MLSDQEYIRQSLEFNLFFLRIAKEHAIFAAASLPPRDTMTANRLITVKNSYEALLSEAVRMADGIVGADIIASNELVTDLTLNAEIKTQYLTGLSINTNITKRELAFKPGKFPIDAEDFIDDVSGLNKRVLTLTRSTIVFLEKLLDSVEKCQAFSFTYPAMIEHVTHESIFAAMMLEKLEERDAVTGIKEAIDHELTWNDIMSEHTKFIRGYLDPSEEKLFEAANSFAKEFDLLLEKTRKLPKHPELLSQVTDESLREVKELRSFKAQSTQGILQCKIKSVIIPLLSDHVTREANYYLRMLARFEKTDLKY